MYIMRIDFGFLFYSIDLQSPGYERIFEKDCGLKSTDSLGFRIPLIETSNASSAIPPQSVTAKEFINNKLSNLQIKSIDDNSSSSSSSSILEPPLPPTIKSINSFLMKHETKFIGIFGQQVGSNNEEFNNIISNDDKHMTLCITWKTKINDNNSMQRITYGQHFIQLRNLYET